MLQLPIPAPSPTSSHDTRAVHAGAEAGPSTPRRDAVEWYNLLLDPWLAGSQSDVASWFSKQYHAQPPARESISAVQDLIREVESLTREYTGEIDIDREQASASQTGKEQERGGGGEGGGKIHAVAISHEFTDHCHRSTLLQLDPSVIVLAAPKAAALVRSWKHFEGVYDLPVFQRDWKGELGGVGGLPAWVGVGRVQTSGDAFYYHSAVMVVWDQQATATSTTTPTPTPTPVSGSTSSGSTSIASTKQSSSRTSESDSDSASAGASEHSAECIIYTPHGIKSPTLSSLLTARPPLRPLCFLHGLHDVSIDWGQQLNLGAHNGLAAQAVLRAKYWVGTHDEVKKGGGVVSWFLRRRTYTVQDALRKAGQLADHAYDEVGNGEAIVLL